MVHLPTWTPLVLVLAISIHGADYFFCDAQLASTNNSPIGFFNGLQDHLAFTGCTHDPQTGAASSGFASWFVWFLFILGTLPILLLLYVLIAPLLVGLLSNSIAGTITAVVGLAALFVFFGALIATS